MQTPIQINVRMPWLWTSGSLLSRLKLTIVLPQRKEKNDGVLACAGESASVGSSGAVRSTVFINDVAFEVGVGPFNLREAFGDDFVLIHSSGQPVLTNEWGVTFHSLQRGASYYLVPISMNEHVSFYFPSHITIFYYS